MNDPNGAFFLDGELHMTYQHNPDEPRWGRMHWGHASSRDLLTWRHHPLALSPAATGPDAAGCWSGSIVQADGKGVAFYTGVELDGELRRQRVCRAVSVDAGRLSWRASAGNPVVAGPPEGVAPDLFRDPFVSRSADGWLILVGAGTIDGHGAVLRYRSDDLETWRSDGVVLASADLDPAVGADGPMWECPQLLRTPSADVLVVSVVDRSPGIRPSHVVAFVGRLGDEGFEVRGVQRLGMGPDFYAPAACQAPDGRWLLFGWIPEDPPDASSDRDWAGSLTFPRVVSVLDADRVSLSLATEVAAARGAGRSLGAVTLWPDEPPLEPELPPGPFELHLRLEPADSAEAVVELRDSDATPLARITWRASQRLLTVARRGIVSVAGRSAVSSVELPEADGPEASIRILVDGSILELETNGHTMATARLSLGVSAGRSVAVSAVGGSVLVRSADAWPLVGPASRAGRVDG
jgi:beta-fructofuranosidase